MFFFLVYLFPKLLTGIRVVANAGGVNPLACSEALAILAKEQGVDLSIATVTGDDLMDKVWVSVKKSSSLELFTT